MFDFETNSEVETLDTVPEQFRPFYAQDDASSKFVLRRADPVVKGAVEAISGIHKALGNERKLTQTLKGKVVDLSALAEFGATPEEIRQGIATRISELEARLADPKAKVNIEAIKADLARAYEQEKQALAGSNSALAAQLDRLLVDNAARQALAGLTDDPDLVMPHIQPHVSVVDEDGERRVYIVNERKEVRYNPATQLPMTVGDLVAEMKGTAKYARLFNSQAPAGMPRPQGASRPSQAPAAELSATDKIASGLSALRRQMGQ